jgi:hypothetical protein
MNKLIFFSVCFLALQNICLSQICNCQPGTVITNQHRTEAKHAENYDDFSVKGDTILVSYVDRWERKYKTITNTITRAAGSTNPGRQPHSPEDSLYVLKGFMWFVKQEENDCDLHIEIGPKNVMANRIVIEVTAENSDLQDKIKNHLDQIGEKIMHCGTSNSNTAHFDKPIPVIVIGLGFYDVSHKPNTNHGDVHTKRFSWELHPVQDIIFVQ